MNKFIPVLLLSSLAFANNHYISIKDNSMYDVMAHVGLEHRIIKSGSAGVFWNLSSEQIKSAKLYIMSPGIMEQIIFDRSAGASIDIRVFNTESDYSQVSYRITYM